MKSYAGHARGHKHTQSHETKEKIVSSCVMSVPFSRADECLRATLMRIWNGEIMNRSVLLQILIENLSSDEVAAGKIESKTFNLLFEEV